MLVGDSMIEKENLLPRKEALNLAHNPKGEYWEGQNLAVASIFGAIHNGYKYIALDAPTGTGKSIINAALGNLLGGSHIMTTQKKLQEQYLELGDDYKRVTGRSNFVCKNDKRKTCDVGVCITGPDDFVCPYKPSNTGKYPAFAGKKWSGLEKCPYWANVEEAWHAKHTIFNYAYYVLKMNSEYNEFEPTDIQLLDEGHNLEAYIRNVSSFEITDKSLYHVRYVDDVDTVDDKKFERVERQINGKHDALEWLDSLLRVIELRINDSKDAKAHGNTLVKRRIVKLENMQNRIKTVSQRMHADPDNWVFAKVDNGFKLVPLYIGDYAQNVIFRHANVHIFSSATLPPKKVLCKRFGFEEDEVFYYSMDSPFDPEKAPIFSYPQPTMTWSPNMDAKRAKMGGTIASVMQNYEGQRGLILCNSYSEVRFYENYMQEKFPDCFKRLTVQQRGDNVETLFEEHAAKDDSVLISPSLWEGADLKGELGRFLVIAKVPYPDYKDPVVQGLKEIDKGRYFEDTVMKIRQGVGRVIRSSDDEADIHILDGAFRQIYKYNGKMFPENFSDRVIYI
jgi:Rad3-related DNA helicase